MRRSINYPRLVAMSQMRGLKKFSRSPALAYTPSGSWSTPRGQMVHSHGRARFILRRLLYSPDTAICLRHRCGHNICHRADRNTLFRKKLQRARCSLHFFPQKYLGSGTPTARTCFFVVAHKSRQPALISKTAHHHHLFATFPALNLFLEP